MIHVKKIIEVRGEGWGERKMVKNRSKIKFYLQNLIVKVIFIIICQLQFQSVRVKFQLKCKILPLVSCKIGSTCIIDLFN